MTPLRWDRLRELLGRTTLVGQYNFFSDEPATELSILPPSRRPERESLEEAVDKTLPLF